MATDQYGTTPAPGPDLGELTRPRVATVDTPSMAFNAMACKWELLEALLGGTEAMRAAGARFLPREPLEKPELYENRLRRSFLYNAYKNTVNRLVSKPFTKPVTTDGSDLPEKLQPLLTNTDRSGADLTAFAREMFSSAVSYGKTHVLVDYPKVPQGATLADEQSLGARPVFVHIKPRQLIAWRYRLNEQSGEKVLAQIRIAEHRVESDGDYGEKCVKYIRVFTEATWELHREKEDHTFVEVDRGTHTFGQVPLVPYYILKSGDLESEPPLDDLAWLNLAHWQSLSDQRNILRFARCGILFASGMTEDELAKLALGPNSLFSTVNEKGNLKHVEHSGAAIRSGKEDLDDLEARMEILGLQPLIERTAATTATGKIIDEGRTDSDIQAWIRGLEQTLQECFKLAGKIVGTPIPDDFTVDVFSEFTLSAKAQADVQALIAMRTSIPPQIDHETFLSEIKRRGVLSDTTDIPEVIGKVEAEGPSLSTFGSGPKAEDPTVPDNFPTGAPNKAA